MRTKQLLSSTIVLFLLSCACIEQEQWDCEGIIRGSLIEEKRGKGGFGYDPIFIPTGYSKTFAELGNEIKNTISHRAIATRFFYLELRHLKPACLCRRKWQARSKLNN